MIVIRLSDGVELPINKAIREAAGLVKVLGYTCDLTKAHTKTCMQCKQPCVEYCTYYFEDYQYKCTECLPPPDPLEWYGRPSARGWAVIEIDESQFNLDNIPDWPLIDILYDDDQRDRLINLMRTLRRELDWKRSMCADLAVGAFMHYAETHEELDLNELARDVGFDKFVDTFINTDVLKEPRDHWAIFLGFVNGLYDFMNKKEVRLGYKFAAKVLQTVGYDKEREFELMDSWQQWCYSPEHTPEQEQARMQELLEMEAEGTKLDLSYSKYPEYQRVPIPAGEINWTVPSEDFQVVRYT